MPRRRGFRATSVRAEARVEAWLASLRVSRKEDRMLRKAFDRVVMQVKGDFLHGEVVAVPPGPMFAGMTNLRCEDLAGFRRLLYTVVSTEEGVHVLLVAVLTHPEYDRVFRGRGR